MDDYGGSERRALGSNEVVIYLNGRSDFIRPFVGMPRNKLISALTEGEHAIPANRPGEIVGPLRIGGRPVAMDDTPIEHGQILRLDWLTDKRN